jgi:Cof subfamily protein (haloacid dehalogenase superfamily)
VWIHTYVGETIVTEEPNQYTDIEGELTKLQIKVVDSFVDAVTEPVVKVLMLKEPEILAKVEKKLQKEFAGSLSIMRSKPFFLEFTESGVTKGTSLNSLIQQLGIIRDEVIAIGDGNNDLSMIQFAGLGVAMGNASEAIKAQADFITETNMNDGVAKVVEEFILKTELVKIQ